MTLTTVSAPLVFANTSIFPRNGLSLNRTGPLASSLDPKVSGALDVKRGAAPRAKAMTSRPGATARDVSRILLVVAGFAVRDDEVSLASFAIGAGPLRPVDSPPDNSTSNPASSSLAVSSSAASGDSLRTSTFHLSEESGTGRATMG